MKVITRIRFSGLYGKFYIQRKAGIWPIRWWSTIGKKGRYSSDDADVRWFDNYDEARTFCIRLATDVLLEHKANEFKPLT